MIGINIYLDIKKIIFVVDQAITTQELRDDPELDKMTSGHLSPLLQSTLHQRISCLTTTL